MLRLPPLSRLLALMLCVPVMVVLLVVVVLVVLVVLRVVLLLPLRLRLRLSVRRGFGDRLKVVEKVVLEVRVDRLRVSRARGLHLECWGRPRGGRGAASSLLGGCGFGLGRGLVDERGREGHGGGGG